MKQLSTDLTFVKGGAGSGTVTFNGFTTINLARILLVVNKTRTTDLYILNEPTLGGTTATNVLTLETDTSAMDNGDVLVAWYDEPTGEERRDLITDFEYTATGAQTDDDILGTVAPGTRKVVTAIDVMLGGDSAADVGFRIGFAASTLAAEPTNGVGTATGVFMSHPGLKPGSGIIRKYDRYKIGASGAELRITTTTPTPGKLKLIVSQFDLVA